MPALHAAWIDFEQFLEDFYYSETPKTLAVSLLTQDNNLILSLNHTKGAESIDGEIYFYGQGVWSWRFKHLVDDNTYIYNYRGNADRWRQEDDNITSSFGFYLPQHLEQLLSETETFSFVPTPLYKTALGWRLSDKDIQWLWSENYYDGPITGYGSSSEHRFLRIELVEEQDYSRTRLYSLKPLNRWEEIKLRFSHYLFRYEYYSQKPTAKILVFFAQKLRNLLKNPKDYFKNHKIIGYYML